MIQVASSPHWLIDLLSPSARVSNLTVLVVAPKAVIDHSSNALEPDTIPLFRFIFSSCSNEMVQARKSKQKSPQFYGTWVSGFSRSFLVIRFKGGRYQRFLRFSSSSHRYRCDC